MELNKDRPGEKGVELNKHQQGQVGVEPRQLFTLLGGYSPLPHFWRHPQRLEHFLILIIVTLPFYLLSLPKQIKTFKMLDTPVSKINIREHPDAIAQGPTGRYASETGLN